MNENFDKLNIEHNSIYSENNNELGSMPNDDDNDSVKQILLETEVGQQNKS